MVTIVPARKWPGQDEPITKVLSSQSEERQRDSERERKKCRKRQRERESEREKCSIQDFRKTCVVAPHPSSIQCFICRIEGSGFRV